MPKQPFMWMDYRHNEDGSMTLGIECDDPNLTFDGHYMCLFPQGKDEKDDTGARQRCEEALKFFKGMRQARRNSGE